MAAWPSLSLISEARLPETDALLTLAVVLVVGVSAGALAKRFRLPRITGQIVAGVLIGHAVLNLFDAAAVDSIQPITHFALGLMAVTTGAHLNFSKMRNAGKRLGFLLLAEVTVTPLLVFGGMVVLPGITPGVAALLAAIAISTAPATVVALVKETRSKGVFVKTLIAAVALNNMACIFLFEVARSVLEVEIGGGEGGATILAGLVAAAGQLGKSALLGGTAAVLMELVTRLASRKDRVASAAVATILLTSGAADYIGVSPLAACLFLGLVQTNLSPVRETLVDRVFENFEPAVLAIFFTLAGMHLSFEEIGRAGVVAIVFFTLRIAGKHLSVSWSMKWAGTTERMRRNLGLALLPQAGLAIGLVILIRDDPAFLAHRELIDLFVAVVLTVVTMNEIIGPILTRTALRRAGDIEKDRSRLIDFIQEENITTSLVGRTKEEAIEQLTDLLIRSHHLGDVDRDELRESILLRESQASTCLGGGLAVPHGVLPTGPSMLGVMGLSAEGLDIPTPDGRPVHCMVLLVTPEGERDRHLQVLATLARVIGQNVEIQEALFSAKTPAHAYEILHGEEAEAFNYFLDDD